MVVISVLIRLSPNDVNQRAKLARVLGETALKSFHSGLLNNRHLVGELWSVTNGYYCGSKK
ncbi:MAG: hypothetical protein Q7T48_12155, partial [Cellvibrio sp.]|uniref:hypothetical protein n=1 Tax=Cellvibrio sp. TaxID=1965322 RepID=UPI00271ECAB5|nr:hypothetical protein [Cellvibrio sp.]